MVDTIPFRYGGVLFLERVSSIPFKADLRSMQKIFVRYINIRYME